MKLRDMLIAGFMAGMVGLGIFVNALFLFVAVASLCGLMHVFGHHDGGSHSHRSTTDEKKTETA